MGKDSFTHKIFTMRCCKESHNSVNFYVVKVSFAIIVKTYLKISLFYLLAFSMLSAAVPLHSIIHEHYFVHQDNCGSSCEKHLKNYTKPCCTTSDAVFVGDLPVEPFSFTVNLTSVTVERVDCTDNYFQFFHRTRNKAPPVFS